MWFRPVPEKLVASNLSLQTYEGKPALAWWQGVVTSTGSTESGEDVVVNQHYQTVARIRGKDGWKLTLHAIDISGVDIWVTANKNIAKNLSSYGGAYNGALIDSAVQEYNLKTGKLLLSWDALEHIPLGDSRATVPTNGFPWDAYHVNAIDLTGNGSFLVSMRNTWAAYMVNIQTGKIEWTLGGKHSSFKFGRGAEFQWQHDVALGAGGHPVTITVFDDHCCQLTGGGTSVPATGPSRGLVLKLNQSTHVATLAAQYGNREGFKSEYMGDTQPLANSNTFIGWGSAPYFTEYSAAGKLLLEAEFPGQRPELSHDGGAMGGPAAHRACRRGARRQAARPRCTRAGTAPPRSSPGGSWPAPVPAGWPPWPPPQSPGSRRLSPCHAGYEASRCRRSTRAARDRNFPALLGFDSMMSARQQSFGCVAMCIGLAACGPYLLGEPRCGLPAPRLLADVRAAPRPTRWPSRPSPVPDASPTHADQLPRAPGTHVSDVRVSARTAAPTAVALRAYSTGTGESFLPSHPFVGGRARDGQRHSTVRRRAPTRRAPTSRSPTKRGQPERVPNNAGNSSEVQHYSSAPTLTPSTVRITTPAKAGHPRRPVPRALPGRRHARADDHRTGRQPDLVSPAAGGRVVDEPPGAATKASRC